MGLRITIDLEDSDLDHFRLIMKEARKAAGRASEDEIVVSAEDLLGEVRKGKVPGYIQERLEKLRVLVDMLRDSEWQLPDEEKMRVINALAYFAEPEDLIPDHIPGLGFLDDAIMVELVVRELRHEIQAYQDFCEFRHKYDSGFRLLRDPARREKKLGTRRDQLRERIARRREKDPAPVL